MSSRHGKYDDELPRRRARKAPWSASVVTTIGCLSGLLMLSFFFVCIGLLARMPHGSSVALAPVVTPAPGTPVVPIAPPVEDPVAREAIKQAKAAKQRQIDEEARQERQRKADEQAAKSEAERERVKRNLDQFINDCPKVVRRASVKGNDITITVSNEWHISAYQIRLQAAQNLFKLWASIASPDDWDKAGMTIVDLNGNKVGGHGVFSGVWVQKD